MNIKAGEGSMILSGLWRRCAGIVTSLQSQQRNYVVKFAIVRRLGDARPMQMQPLDLLRRSEGPVFLSSLGNAWNRPESVDNIFVARIAEMDKANWTPHSTAVSGWCANAGCEIWKETKMAWKTPKIVEVPVGMEINMYACASRK